MRPTSIRSRSYLTSGAQRLLNQPWLYRGVFYGVFWGLLFSLLIVYATWNEKRKRVLREQEEAGATASSGRDHAAV